MTIAEKDTALSFTNAYTRQTGSFSVLKTVTGAQAGDKEFTFAYTCTDGTEGSLKAKADGKAVSGPKVPTGTQCTVTEDAKAAAIDGYTLAAPEAQTVTVSEKDQVASTSFVNAYTEVPSTDSPSEDPTASPAGEPKGRLRLIPRPDRGICGNPARPGAGRDRRRCAAGLPPQGLSPGADSRRPQRC